MGEALEVVGARSLWDHLASIPDRRCRKGRQYALPAVLTLALVAVLSGANDLRAVFHWGQRLPPEALFLLGLERESALPCHLPLLLQGPGHHGDGGGDGELGARAADPDPGMGHVALDGKRLRNSTATDHNGTGGVYLVAAFATRLGGVIDQLQVAPDVNEITAVWVRLQRTVLTVASDPMLPSRSLCKKNDRFPSA